MKKQIKGLWVGILLSLNSHVLLAEPLSLRAPYLFPNVYDQGDNDQLATLPKQATHFLSIPFPQTSKVLRVYLSPGCGVTPNCQQMLAKHLLQEGGVDDGETKAYLVIYNPDDRSTVYLGVIHPKFDAHSGVLYMPYAMRGDGQAVILDAWMASPGAGGGDIDKGYALIPIKPVTTPDTNTTDFVTIATRKAVFYDHFRRVITIGDGGKTPLCEKPGPSNDAVVLYRDLLRPNRTRVLADRPDTVYSDLKVDEIRQTVSLAATQYTHLAQRDVCPQQALGEEGAVLQSTKRVRTLSLPLTRPSVNQRRKLTSKQRAILTREISSFSFDV